MENIGEHLDGWPEILGIGQSALWTSAITLIILSIIAYKVIDKKIGISPGKSGSSGEVSRLLKVEIAKSKLAGKGCDLIVFNYAGFQPSRRQKVHAPSFGTSHQKADWNPLGTVRF